MKAFTAVKSSRAKCKQDFCSVPCTVESIAETDIPQAGKPARELISDETWNRLVARVQKDHGLSRVDAERIMDGALNFLNLCAQYPKQRFAPSQKVDIGWHTFLMYTREYAEFCNRVAGRFIHHAPNAPNDMTSIQSLSVVETKIFMLENKVMFDSGVWSSGDTMVSCDTGPQTDCGQGDCNSEGNA